MDFSEAKNIVEDAGFDPQSYSGRNMYGLRCLSFNLGQEETVSDAFLDVAEAIHNFVESDGELDFEDVISEFKGAKVDSMGLGEVVYFPNITWEDDNEEDLEDEE